MKNLVTAAVVIIALVAGVAIGLAVSSDSSDSEETVEYKIDSQNSFQNRVYYAASHNAEKPMWVTVYVDGQQMTLKNGMSSIITDYTQRISFDFDNPTSYSAYELKDHIKLYFDGKEGKMI